MEVCAFVLVAPLSIPTVSLDAWPRCAGTTSPQHLIWSPLRVWPSGLHCSDPPLTLQPRDPSVLWGRKRTPSCPWVRPEPPSSVQVARSCVAQGSPSEAPPSQASFRCILLGGGQPPQRLPRPLCHPCRSLACGRAGLGDQPRFRDSGFVGLGAQSRGRWGLRCGQTALRKGPLCMVAEPRGAPSCWGQPVPRVAVSPAPPLWVSALGGPPFFTALPAWLLP